MNFSVFWVKMCCKAQSGHIYASNTSQILCLLFMLYNGWWIKLSHRWLKNEFKVNWTCESVHQLFFSAYYANHWHGNLLVSPDHITLKNPLRKWNQKQVDNLTVVFFNNKHSAVVSIRSFFHQYYNCRLFVNGDDIECVNK